MIKRFLTALLLTFALTLPAFGQRTVVSAANLFKGDSLNIATINKGSYTIPANGVWDWKKGDDVVLNLASSTGTLTFSNTGTGKEKTLTITSTVAVTTLTWPSGIISQIALPTSFPLNRIEIWKLYSTGSGIIAMFISSSTAVDRTPPNKITNLVVNTPTTTTATFNFTAPSDNSGSVTSYDVRVSTYPIAENVTGGYGGPPVYAAHGEAIVTAVDSIRVAINCGTASSRAIFAHIGWYNWDSQTITGVYNRTTGTSFTNITSSSYGSDGMTSEMWYNVAPATGINYVTVKFSAVPYYPGMTLSAWSNVDQSTPAGTSAAANGSSSAPSVNVSSSSTKIVLDGVYVNVNPGATSETVGPNQTLIVQHDNIPTYDSWFAMSYEAGASTTTMSHTLDRSTGWASIGVEINPASTSDTVLWLNATTLSGEPTPKAAGQSESFILGGLTANTTYYARVKSSDAAGNISDSSNQSTVTTATATGTDPGLSGGYNGFPGGPSVSGGAHGFYLDSSKASDAGDGLSLATAKKTWAALKSVMSAYNGNSLYDTVWIKTGTYSEIMSIEVGGWSPSHRLVIMRYGGDRVIFEGANDNIVQVVSTGGNDNLVIQGIKFRDGEFTERRYDGGGVYLVETGASAYLNISWCYVVTQADSAEFVDYASFHSRGVNIAGSWVKMEDCYVRGFSMGIVISGNPDALGQNIILRRDTSVFSVWSNLTIGTNDVASNTNARRLLVEYCVFDTTWGEDNIQFEHYYGNPGGYNPENNKGTIIRYCELGFGAENNFDFKGCSDIFFYHNLLWGSFGDDDGPWINGITGNTGPAMATGWPNNNDPASGSAYPRHVVMRHNTLIDGNGGADITKNCQFVNNTLLNMRFSIAGHNQTSGIQDGIQFYGDDRVKTFLNNIVANCALDILTKMENSGPKIYFNNNCYYDTLGSSTFSSRYQDGATSVTVTGLAAWKSVLSTNVNGFYTNVVGKDANSTEVHPSFTTNTTLPTGRITAYDFTPAVGSSVRGTGTTVTFATNTGSNSTNLVVDNPLVFHGQWTGIVEGDYIYVGSNIVGQRARIVTIDWISGAITLDQPIVTWNSGDVVHWADEPAYNGRPNIGAK